MLAITKVIVSFNIYIFELYTLIVFILPYLSLKYVKGNISSIKKHDKRLVRLIKTNYI